MPLGLEKTRQLSTGEKSAPFFFKHIKSKRQAETKKSYEDDGRTRRADGLLFDYDSAADQKSAVKEQPPVFPDDLLNTEDEEEKFARERRLKAWWGNRPERSRSDFGVKVTRPSTQERRALDETREARLLESVRVLEQMMQQRTFKEGDQEMLMSAFKAIDSDGSGRIDYDEFWAALAPITNNLRDSDRKELFMKVDADCSGSVGMIDFLNFFLVTDYEQLQRPATGRSSAQSPPPPPLAAPAPHCPRTPAPQCAPAPRRAAAHSRGGRGRSGGPADGDQARGGGCEADAVLLAGGSRRCAGAQGAQCAAHRARGRRGARGRCAERAGCGCRT